MLSPVKPVCVLPSMVMLPRVSAGNAVTGLMTKTSGAASPPSVLSMSTKFASLDAMLN
ncbi:hypothetical protein D3C83_215980 [compost metagenome]